MYRVRNLAIAFGIFVLAVAGSTSAAQAQPVEFFLPGITPSPIKIDFIDFAPGNAVLLFPGHPDSPFPKDFASLFQGTVANLILGGVAVTPPGNGTLYELTVVVAAQNAATLIAPGVIENVALRGGRLSMFFSTPANANPNTGTGFTDGTLVLSGFHVPTGVKIPGTNTRDPAGFLTNAGGAFPLGGASDPTDPRLTNSIQSGLPFGTAIDFVNPDFFPDFAVEEPHPDPNSRSHDRGKHRRPRLVLVGSPQIQAPFTASQTLDPGAALFAGSNLGHPFDPVVPLVPLPPNVNGTDPLAILVQSHPQAGLIEVRSEKRKDD